MVTILIFEQSLAIVHLIIIISGTLVIIISGTLVIVFSGTILTYLVELFLINGFLRFFKV